MNVSEILMEIHTFSLKKMHLKILSAKWQPFCLSLNLLNSSRGQWVNGYNYCSSWIENPLLLFFIFSMNFLWKCHRCFITPIRSVSALYIFVVSGKDRKLSCLDSIKHIHIALLSDKVSWHMEMDIANFMHVLKWTLVLMKRSIGGQFRMVQARWRPFRTNYQWSFMLNYQW